MTIVYYINNTQTSLFQSLSEESVSSPRAKSPDSKRRDFNRAHKSGHPGKLWWESSGEGDSASTDVVQSWFKTPTVKEEDEETDEDGNLQATKSDPNDKQFKQPQADTNVSVTISKDSLDCGGQL